MAPEVTPDIPMSREGEGLELASSSAKNKALYFPQPPARNTRSRTKKEAGALLDQQTSTSSPPLKKDASRNSSFKSKPSPKGMAVKNLPAKSRKDNVNASLKSLPVRPPESCALEKLPDAKASEGDLDPERKCGSDVTDERLVNPLLPIPAPALHGLPVLRKAPVLSQEEDEVEVEVTASGQVDDAKPPSHVGIDKSEATANFLSKVNGDMKPSTPVTHGNSRPRKSPRPRTGRRKRLYDVDTSDEDFVTPRTKQKQSRVRKQTFDGAVSRAKRKSVTPRASLDRKEESFAHVEENIDSEEIEKVEEEMRKPITHPSVYKSATRMSGVLLAELQNACQILFKKYQNVIMEWGVHLGFQDQGARLMIAVDQESLDAIKTIGFVTLGDRSQKYLEQHPELSRSFPGGPLKEFLLGGIKVDLNDQDVVCLEGSREKECDGFAGVFSEHVAPFCLLEMMGDPDPEIARAARILQYDCMSTELEVQLASESPHKVRCSYAQLSLQSRDFGNHVDQICAGFRVHKDRRCEFIGGDGPGRYLFTRTVKGNGQIHLYKSDARPSGHSWSTVVDPFNVGPGEGYGIWGVAREEWSHEVRLVGEDGEMLKTVGRTTKGVPHMNQTPRVSITYRMYREGEKPIVEHAREMGLSNLRLHLAGKSEVAPDSVQACVE